MNLIRDLKIPALIIWILFTASYGFSVWFNSIYSGYGKKLAEMEDRINELILENQLLENEIASASALRHIEIKAKEMGFVFPKVVYIK